MGAILCTGMARNLTYTGNNGYFRQKNNSQTSITEKNNYQNNC